MAQSDPQLIYTSDTTGERLEVWEDAARRWLVLEDGLVQSEILIDEPGLLPSVLNRAMLAGLIFADRSDSVLLAGTGGGATARFIHHEFPHISGVAIEKSRQVAKIAREHFHFPESAHWQLIIEDVEHYIQQTDQQFDLIVVDIAEDQLTPAWVTEIRFLLACRNRLNPNGHVSINLLVDDASQFLERLGAIRQVFGRQTLCLGLPKNRNTVILAFNQRPSQPPPVARETLVALEGRWHIEFSDFYDQMLKNNPEGSGIF